MSFGGLADKFHGCLHHPPSLILVSLWRIMETLVLLMPALLISICLHGGILKVAARLLRYQRSGKLSFLFALAMVTLAMASRAAQLAIGYSLPVWLAFVFVLVVCAVWALDCFVSQRPILWSGPWLIWRASICCMRLPGDNYLCATAFGFVSCSQFPSYDSALSNR